MTTWTQTLDDVPVVDTAAAQESASRLYRVSSLAEAGGDRLATAQAPSWTGQAQQLSDEARATASGGFLAVDEAANRLGRAVDTYACDVPTPLRRWRDLVDDLARARAHPVAPGPDGVLDPSAHARVESDLLTDIEVQKRLFQQATADLVSHADAVTRGLDTVRGIDDHIEEGFGYLIDSTAESVVAGVQLAFGWIHDPDRWRDQVTATGMGAVQYLTRPTRACLETLHDDADGTSCPEAVTREQIDMAAEMAGEQAYRDGDYGVGVAQSAQTAAFTVGLLHHLLRAGRAGAGGRGEALDELDELDAPPRPVIAADMPEAPLILPQTTAELFEGVDLRRQEGHPRAHTLEMHVGWSTRDLARRSGELSAGQPSPHPASSFPDLVTAERAVDRALTAERATVDAWSVTGKPRAITLVVDVGEVIGVSVTRVDGRPFAVKQTVVTVMLRRDGDGNVIVVTAYPGKWVPRS